METDITISKPGLSDLERSVFHSADLYEEGQLAVLHGLFPSASHSDLEELAETAKRLSDLALARLLDEDTSALREVVTRIEAAGGAL